MPTRPHPPFARRLRTTPAALALGALTLAGALLLAGCGDKGAPGAAKPAAAPGAMPPAAVSVLTLRPQDVTLTRELPGRAAPSLVADVRPQVGGLVLARLFTEGSLVRAGQPLYRLDDAPYRSASASAKAALTKARAAQAAARVNARRAAELVAIDALSKQDNDNAQAALRLADADVQVAQAAVDTAAVNLGRAQIVAPIGGRIGRSFVTPGALVVAGQPTALATILQLDPMHVDVTQSGAELLALRRELVAGSLGATDRLPVTLLLEDGSTYVHKGRLAFSEAAADAATGAVTLRIVVPNPQQWILPGSYVRAVVGNGMRRNALLLPQQALSLDPKGHAAVYVVGADGKAEQRQVMVNRAVGAHWLVDSGLAAGDRVVVEGLQKVHPGAPVQASEVSAAPSAAPAVPASAAPGAAAASAAAAPASAPPATAASAPATASASAAAAR